jgi:hypothetical protein
MNVTILKKISSGLPFLLLSLAGVAGADDYNPEEMFICGGPEVYVLGINDNWTDPESVRWIWRAADSPEIPADQRELFITTDDCKPVLDGTHVLITSSSGGVALVRKIDKSAVFLDRATNAHSAEILPDGVVAIASSNGGDQVIVCSRNSEGRVRRGYPLKGAHGTVWDRQRKVLWALGNTLIQKYRYNFKPADPKLTLLREIEIPRGGHDLFPRYSSGALFVTTHDKLLEFDPATEKWAVLENFVPNSLNVKSITDNQKTGQIAYMRATESWWSDTFRFLKPATSRTIPGARFYKGRWNQPNSFSYVD